MNQPAPASPPPAAPPSGSARGWQIAFAIVVVLLLGGILYALLRDDGSDSTVSVQPPATASGGASETPTEGGSDDEAPVPEVQEIDCSASALAAAAPADVQAVDAVVVDFACSPASAGDVAGGFGWARFAAPGLDELDVFYTALEGVGDEGAVFGDWVVVDFGTAVFCDDFIPAAACAEFLPAAPRR